MGGAEVEEEAVVVVVLQLLQGKLQLKRRNQRKRKKRKKLTWVVVWICLEMKMVVEVMITRGIPDLCQTFSDDIEDQDIFSSSCLLLSTPNHQNHICDVRSISINFVTAMNKARHAN